MTVNAAIRRMPPWPTPEGEQTVTSELRAEPGEAWARDEGQAGHLGRHRRAPEARSSCREVFAIGEFRALWSAQVLSFAGDQFAQVAIAILVYGRTHSPFLTALAYALTYLPPIAGGPLLSSLADLFPRRRVMIVCDLFRVGTVGLVAIPGLPFSCSAPPSATSPTRPARFSASWRAPPSSPCPTAQDAGHQRCDVRPVGPHPPDRSAEPPGARSRRRGPGLAVVRVGGRRPDRLRQPPAAVRLAGRLLHEGLAAPYARSPHGNALTVGLLMAALSLGMVTGAFVISRIAARPRGSG